MGKTLFALREALDNEGMEDKQIGYTTRLSAFWNSEPIPSGYTSYYTDGEGITIATEVQNLGSSLNQVVDWVNIMMYDVGPAAYGAPGGFTLDTYKKVFDAFAKCVGDDKIVMGFEPGGQAGDGIWEGEEVDNQVMAYVRDKNYGGILFWAINQPVWPPSTEVTGENAQELAEYAVGIF